MATTKEFDEKRNRKAMLKSKAFPFMMLSPFFILTGIFVFIPIILMVVMSFTNMGLSLEWNFIGFKNYEYMFKDPSVPTIIIRTFVFVIVCTVFSIIGSVFIAVMTTFYLDVIYKKENAGLFFRIIWLIPSLTPSVVYAFIWRFVFGSTEQSLINGILHFFGIAPIIWLSDYAMLIMMFICCLSSASGSIILFGSAIRQIPTAIIHASKVDGASNYQLLSKIVMPYLIWPITQKTLWSVLGFFCTYEIIRLMTYGGPANKTTTFAYYIYKTAFDFKKFGMGSALSVVLVTMSCILGLIVLKIFNVEKQLQDPRMDI